jgi:hypothetical protein
VWLTCTSEAPLIWEAFYEPAQGDYSKSMKSYQKRHKKWEKDHGDAYRAAAAAKLQPSQQAMTGEL